MLPKSLHSHVATLSALAFLLPSLIARADEVGDKDPLGPLESFGAWRDSLSEGRFGDTFALFPESYQKDINGLATKFASRMDEDLWNGAIGIVGTISNILNTKKDIISKSKFFAKADEETQAKMLDSWDDAAEMTAAFSKSEILDLEVWKKGDVGAVLNGPVSKFVERLAKMEIPGNEGIDAAMAKLKDSKGELVSEDGDSAVLRVTGAEGDVNESEIVKVEGRWVPADMAGDWDSQMAEASKALDQMDFDTPEFQQQKMMVMMGLGMANQMLKQLEGAASPEEFDRTVEAMMKLFGGGGPLF